MATSPLFGWEEPDDTDLVKDGAAAIRTLGNAIDTSMGDLLGGTSGQVLSKNSNTNMDFTWVTSDDANAIQNAIVDAKGDLIAATAADTPARLAVGTNGQYLQADSTAATGLKWATVSTTPTFVGVSALRNGVSTAMTANTAFAVAYTTEQYDTNTFHDNSTNNTRITIPSGYGGKYQLSAFIANPYGTPGSYMIMYVYKNGSIFTDSTFFGGQAVRMNTGVYNTLALSTTITTVATDYWEIYYQQGATETQLFYSNFQLSYLGA
jgi:hypothetical protein